MITLSGSSAVTHEAATAYSDAGATWTDTLDGSDSAPANGSVNVNVPGVYTLTFDFNDTVGNAATQITRTVTVQDTTIPVITLSGSSTVTHEAVTAYSDGCHLDGYLGRKRLRFGKRFRERQRTRSLYADL